MTRNIKAKILKTDQSTFIKDLVKEKRLSSFNSRNISINARCFIEMIKKDDYEKTNLKTYQQLADKLIYLLFGIRPNIAFVIG